MENWKISQRIDLSRGCSDPGVWPHTLMVRGDKLAHRWEIEVYNTGKAVNLSGATITAYFNRMDNVTVPVKGSASGNKATVTLSDACYAINGPLTGIFRAATEDGMVLTLSVLRFTVAGGPGEAIYDPNGVIPNLDELLAMIDEMDAAAARANQAAEDSRAATAEHIAGSQAVMENLVQSSADAIANLTDYTKEYGLRVRGETQKASGNPIKIYPDAGSLLKPVTTIKVTQEGSGDPYPAGGGKNLLDSSLFPAATTQGITFEPQADGIKVSGTATGYANTKIENFILPAGTYVMSISGASGVSVYLRRYFSDGTNETVYSGNPITIDGSETQINIYLQVNTGVTVNGVAYPQLEAGSVATDYAPYANIRPIIGYNKLDLNRVGKNLLPNTAVSVTKNGLTYTVNNDGSITVNGTCDSNSFFTICESVKLPKGEYILSGNPQGITYSQVRLYVDKYDSMTESHKITLETAQALKVNIVVFRGEVLNNVVFKPMLRLASDPDATYEPYAGTLHTVQIGQTVYGGRFDWDMGVMVVDKKFVSLTADNITRSHSNYNKTCDIFVVSHSGIPTDLSSVGDVICSHGKALTANEQYVNNITCVAVNDKGKVIITFEDILTEENAKAYITEQANAGTPIQIAYKLAQPIEIQLAPTAVLATETEGVNYIYGDGDIEVEYVIPLKQSIAKRVDMLLDTFAEPFEKSGDIVTCQPVAGIEFDSVVTVLEPKQAGSGDPYPAGGGKNKLNNTATTQTINGVTFTVNADGTVTVNGTATDGNAVFRIQCKLSVGETYTLSGCPAGGSQQTYFVQLGYFGNDIGNGVTAIVTEQTGTTVALLVMQGTTVSNLLFKPMIRLASDPDVTYAPYSNIRPITGWDSVGLGHAGKNLAHLTFRDVIPSVVSGNDVAVSAWASDYIFIGENNVAMSRSSATNATVMYLLLYDSAKKYIGYVSNSIAGAASKSVDVSGHENARYCRVRFDEKADTDVRVQLEIGSTVSDFQPYAGTSHAVQIGQTVYGGRFDWLTGKLTAEWAMLTLDGTEPWSLNESMYYMAWLGLTNYETSKTAVVCSHFKGVKSNEYDTNMASISGGTVALRNDAVFGNPSTLTADDFKSYLAAQYTAGTPVQIAYKLATPIEIQLTPTEIIALSGVNNLYGSGKTTMAGRQSKDVDILRRLTTLEALMSN